MGQQEHIHSKLPPYEGPPPDERQVVVTGKLTYDDLAEMRRYVEVFKINTLVWWGAIAVSMLLAGLVWITDFDRRSVEPWRISSYIILLLWPIAYSFTNWLNGISTDRKTAKQLEESTLRVERLSLTISLRAHESRHPWRVVEKILETPQGLIFFAGAKKAWFMLPSRVLTEKASGVIINLAIINHVPVWTISTWRPFRKRQVTSTASSAYIGSRDSGSDAANMEGVDDILQYDLTYTPEDIANWSIRHFDQTDGKKYKGFYIGVIVFVLAMAVFGMLSGNVPWIAVPLLAFLLVIPVLLKKAAASNAKTLYSATRRMQLPTRIIVTSEDVVTFYNGTGTRVTWSTLQTFVNSYGIYFLVGNQVWLLLPHRETTSNQHEMILACAKAQNAKVIIASDYEKASTPPI